jgi:hypothetical protein
LQSWRGCARKHIKIIARGLPRSGRRATFDERAGGHRVSGTCELGAMMGKLILEAINPMESPR